MEGIVEAEGGRLEEWGGGSTEEAPDNSRVGVPMEEGGAGKDNRGNSSRAGTETVRTEELPAGRPASGNQRVGVVDNADSEVRIVGHIHRGNSSGAGTATVRTKDLPAGRPASGNQRVGVVDDADSEVRIVGHILPRETKSQDNEPRGGASAGKLGSFAGMSFQLDSDDDDDASTSSSYGPTGAIDEPAISSTHFDRHMRSLEWMYAQLQLRENNYIRLRNLLMRDLALVEAAIWNKEEENEQRERTSR
ncbi:hypothetical protein CC1G_12554 [Coprinopsis cinerea okayama7|uniref:Uncharacterized protein n=1 Tax=Coprinopsis cinerea (strain Okayama-7 / 130 / ATCC MYA-4618 / FGSC 9003) TaxID=240176 RepID=A8PH84_COPC7|nr:hypothetical protein CC1G_12554 [Coprinopsis cinerea okayama7\|eukprot:XP_001841356.2 hypothetical protein CC1G_12554 [Coprinopsis cinerea okayama7\